MTRGDGDGDAVRDTLIIGTLKRVMRIRLRVYAMHWTNALWICILFVMQNYLTNVWKLSFTHSAAILNIWGSISRILPLFFLLISESTSGDFIILILSGSAYTVGMALLTLSTPPILANRSRSCKEYEPQCIGHSQKVLFYTGMASIAIAVAARRSSLLTFSEDQLGHDDEDRRTSLIKKVVILVMSLTPVVGIFLFPYIQKWSLLFGISTIGMAFATLLFLSGWSTYLKIRPIGSVMITVCRVFVAFAFKMFQPYPTDARMLYQFDSTESQLVRPTRFLRFMEKAAIISPNVSLEDQKKKRWRLSSVREVEYAKFLVRMIPLWITFLSVGTVSSIGNTYFVEQGSHMNRKLGSWMVPSQVLLAVFFLGKKLFFLIAEYVEKRCRSIIGITISMIFSVACCLSASGVEMWRLRVVRKHGLVEKADEVVPLSAYWLFFQFFLLAGMDAFFETSSASLITHQAPPAMKKYMSFFHDGVIGLGFMFGVVSIYVVGKVTEDKDKASWFKYTLDMSRLDRYYWVLSGASFVNLLAFVLIASQYRIKDWEASEPFPYDDVELE